ncbi:hypothetical protein BC829DRAFT_443660 [Chytridium lagenaria]|nr:hypothetical protein BC829DRAFT_443660 [Chytridium lagenaria]
MSVLPYNYTGTWASTTNFPVGCEASLSDCHVACSTNLTITHSLKEKYDHLVFTFTPETKDRTGQSCNCSMTHPVEECYRPGSTFSSCELRVLLNAKDEASYAPKISSTSSSRTAACYTNTGSQSYGLSSGAIVGITAACVTVAACALAAVLYHKRKSHTTHSNINAENPNDKA